MTSVGALAKQSLERLVENKLQEPKSWKLGAIFIIADLLSQE